MPDILDTAQALIEENLERFLRERKIVTPAYSGHCLACAEPIAARRFCDSDCRTLYETELRPRLVVRGLLPSA